MRCVGNDVYHPAMLRRIKRLVGKSTVRVACDEQDSDTLLGFVVVEPGQGVLHYAYVRKDLRGNGITSSMLDGITVKEMTHRRDRIPSGIIYNPFRLEEP